MLPIQFGCLRYYQRRIFDLEVEGTWVGRVHETYACKGDFPRFEHPHIHHSRGPLAATNQAGRNMRIFKRWLKEAPDEWGGHTWYGYGNELWWHHHWTEAADAYAKTIELGTWADELYYAYIRRARCLIDTRRWKEAIAALAEATLVKPMWKDAYLWMSRIYYNYRQYDLCLELDALAKTKQIPDTTLPVVEPDTYAAHQDWYVKKATQLKGQ